MKVDTPIGPAVTRLPEVLEQAAEHSTRAVKEAAQEASDGAKKAVQHISVVAGDVVHFATDSGKEMCHSMSEKIEETVLSTKGRVRQNPLPFVLGALACGAAVGFLIVMTRREEPTFRSRYFDEPSHAARDAIHAALAPVARRLHDGYVSSRAGVASALDPMQGLRPERTAHSWSDQLVRVGKTLKFW